MLKTGLTSVTFRGLSAEKIIRLASEARLDGIEWGGDVHVPPADPAAARRIGDATRAVGLRVLSYGSYWRVGAATPGDDAALIAAAEALGAPRIRIWAGSRNAEDLADGDFLAIADRIGALCGLAAEHGLEIATEFHRNTATSTAEGAARLLRDVKAANFSTYWQPDPNVRSEAENLATLEAVLPRVSCFHVFQWDRGPIRRPLAEGEAFWRQCLSRYADAHPDGDAILEFVRDDSPDAFREDAATLRGWLAAP